MKKKIAIGVLILTFLACFAFIGVQFSSSNTIENQVKIGYQSQSQHFIWLLAEDQGLFKKHGIKAELISMASANEINDALASGRIDAGLVNFYVSMPAEAKSSGYAKIYRVSYFTKSAPQSFVLVHLDS